MALAVMPNCSSATLKAHETPTATTTTGRFRLLGLLTQPVALEAST